MECNASLINILSARFGTSHGKFDLFRTVLDLETCVDQPREWEWEWEPTISDMPKPSSN